MGGVYQTHDVLNFVQEVLGGREHEEEQRRVRALQEQKESRERQEQRDREQRGASRRFEGEEHSRARQRAQHGARGLTQSGSLQLAEAARTAQAQASVEAAHGEDFAPNGEGEKVRRTKPASLLAQGASSFETRRIS